MKRIPQLCILVGLAMLAASCGGNSVLDDTEAAVVIALEIEEYNPEIDICLNAGFDVAIAQMNVYSSPKQPGVILGPNQDVNISRWAITPIRSDGGTTASPEWSIDQGVYVPADGEVSLENWRVFPAEYFDLLPLSHLLPENGGVDPETGNRNIRQTLRVQLFGRTVSGKAVSSEPISIAFNFFCFSP
jgi:hypothetical protein